MVAASTVQFLPSEWRTLRFNSAGAVCGTKNALLSKTRLVSQKTLGASRQQRNSLVEALLELLAATSGDEGIRRYSKAIEFYAKNIEKVSS
jgi:hypothetical protein